MLGIGFIIARFVAIQKPWQRKYHSSCNRSVHRETAHGKQEVKVCKRKTPHLFLMRSFLPPCGDKLQCHHINVSFDGYSFPSPYGDKLKLVVAFIIWTSFRGFRPLTGMVPPLSSISTLSICFRPLTGMVLCLMSLLCFPLSFRPLTGMVHRACTPPALHRGFRPLAGISCNERSVFHER